MAEAMECTAVYYDIALKLPLAMRADPAIPEEPQTPFRNVPSDEST